MLQSGLRRLALLLALPALLAAGKRLPDDVKIEAAKKLARETYRGELGKADEAALTAMLDAADATTDDDAGQAALYLLAAQAAEQGERWRMAFDAIDRLGERFDYDALQAKCEVLRGAVKTARTNETRVIVANRAVELFDEALRAERLDVGGDALALAQSAAVKLRDAALRKELADKKKNLDKLKRDSEAEERRLDAAREKLKREPNDPQANEVVGRHMAIRGAWTWAPARLAKADDDDLRRAAVADAMAQKDPTQQMLAADSWWDVADGADGRERSAFRSRAVYWYSLAAPTVTGLPKTRAAKRIKEAGDAASEAPAWQAGMDGKAVDLMLAPGVTLRLLRVPASDDGRIRPFWLAATETTEAQWCALMGGEPANSTLPKVGISFNDARTYCDKLNGLPVARRYRLRPPTLDEFRYAVGDFAQYGLDGAWWRENSPERIRPVATRKANAYGLFDLLGNTWEFAADGRFYGWSAWDSWPNKAVPITACQLPPDYKGDPADYVGGNVGVRIAAELR
jgi:hypothetical protein